MIPILRASDAGELKRRVMNRSQLQNEEVSRIVKEIVARVRQEGDAALFDYTAKFDHVTMTAETVLVTKDEIARAYAAASPEWLDAMRESARRITAFHEKQKQNTWLNFDPAISLGQKITPLKRVGVYVPGGTAAYPSSVLMNVLPAKVAGVKEIIMVTPPGRDGSVSYPLALVAADLAGVDKIYKVGGAQAVAALAFGTESIPRVDKITGPGNIFVANAKREVFGHVGIDMVAGPSEVLVIADDSANPRYVAADLLSQAEHDPLAAAILVTDSETLAAAVQAEIARQTALLPRRSRRRLNYLPVAGAPRTRGHTASGRVGGIRNPHAAQRQRSLERHGRPPGAMRLPIYIPYRRLRNHRPREPRCQGRNHGLRQRRGDPRC